MFNDFWRNGHAFMPFLLPILVPTTDPDEDVDTSLTFNAEWAPIVLGALKVLLRPETWRGNDQNDIELATRRAQMLLDRFQDVDLDCPAFYIDKTQIYGSWDESLADLQAIDTGDCPGQEREYSCDVQEIPIVGGSKVILGLFSVVDDTPVGGLIDELYVSNTDPLAATPVYVFEWDDCLGNHNLETISTDPWVRNNFVAKNIQITGAYSMSVDIGVSGPIVCSEA